MMASGRIVRFVLLLWLCVGVGWDLANTGDYETKDACSLRCATLIPLGVVLT